MASDDENVDYSSVELSSDDLSEEFSDDEHTHDADETQPALKRQKVAARHLDAIHGLGDGIDHEKEAEASILQLEIEELLSEVALPLDKATACHDCVQRVVAALKNLPEAEVKPEPIKGILMNFKFTPTKPFHFKTPTRVDAVGSFSISSMLDNGTPVDIAVEMPAACFVDKDRLNHRYHAKRALYLHHIASNLKKKSSELRILGIEWTLVRGDPRRPALQLCLEDSATPVRILPALGPGIFTLQKLGPDRNNLRSVRAPSPSRSESQDRALDLLPTPVYNSGILEDMMFFQHADVLQAAASIAPAFAEAATLLRVWTTRQRVADGADGVQGFFLTMLLAHLLHTGRAAAGMNSMNLFRTTLISLADRSLFAGAGVSMHANNSMQKMSENAKISKGSSLPASGTMASPPPKAFLSAGAGTIIFIDPSGWLNLALSVSKAALAQGRACAERTAALLAASSGPDAFDAAFLSHQQLAPLYDTWYTVTFPPRDATRGLNPLDHDLLPWQLADKEVAEIAERALGPRAVLVRTFFRSATPLSSSLSLKKGDMFTAPNRSYVLLGARLDPTTSLREVDIGPPADSGAPAEQFRSFWGDKSELRRFQDGKICEAVAWQVGISQRHVIVDHAVRHALLRHLPTGAVVNSTSDMLDGALVRSGGEGGIHTLDEDLEAARACEAASGRLGKRLKALDGLALRIVGTQPLASVLRHAEVFPPFPHPLAGAPQRNGDAVQKEIGPILLPRCIPAVELLCQLEGSGRWPDGPAAFAKMKAALGVQLAESLQSNFGIPAFASEEYVDLFSEGFAFRLILHTERDAAMHQLRMREGMGPVDPGGLVLRHLNPPPPEEDTALRVWHQGTISAVAAANPAFEPTVHLAKRWVASQWLSPHLKDEAVELVVAAACAPGGPGGGVAALPPASRVCGLLRFLNLLGNHPWSAQPLVVDVGSGEAGYAKREAASRALAAQRSAGASPPAMFLTGQKCEECLGWTREKPTKAMLYRAAVLARRAAEKLESLLLNMEGGEGVGDNGNVDVAHPRNKMTDAIALTDVFGHNEDEYEVLIRLRSDALPRGGEALRLTKLRDQGRGEKEEKKKKSMCVRRDQAVAGAAAAPEKVVYAPRMSGEEAKLCRAVLKGIPHRVVESRGASAVRKELLVDFDPLPIYVSALEQRFEGVAVVCADYYGGSVVGLKLQGPALAAGALQPERAHALCPVGPAGGQTGSGGGELMVCADIAAIAADAAALGPGLVESVEYKKSLAANDEDQRARTL